MLDCEHITVTNRTMTFMVKMLSFQTLCGMAQALEYSCFVSSTVQKVIMQALEARKNCIIQNLRNLKLNKLIQISPLKHTKEKNHFN